MRAVILMLGGAVIFMLERDEKIIREKIVENILKATEQIKKRLLPGSGEKAMQYLGLRKPL